MPARSSHSIAGVPSSARPCECGLKRHPRFSVAPRRAAYKSRMYIDIRPMRAFLATRLPRPARAPGMAAMAVALVLATAAQAQSVQPNRYGTPPAIPPASTHYEQQRQAAEDAQRRQDDASRRVEQDRIGLAIDANRRKVEADRARTDRQRATARSPAESERMRLDYEQRRQAYEREREELERQRAEAGSRPPSQP